MAIRVGFNGIFEGTTVYQLDILSRYLDLLEPHIEQSRQEWKKDIEARASSIEDPEEKDEFFDWHSDTNWDFEEYHSIFCNYFLVTVYAAMEARLGQLCEMVRRKRKLRISWSDLKDGGLGKASKYLELVGEIQSPKQENEWKTVRMYGELRNRIVHDGARISKNNEALWKFAKEKDLIVEAGAHPDDLIKVSPGFCREVLQDTKMFLLHIHRKVNQGLYPDSV